MKEGWLWLSILNTTTSPSPISTTPAFSPGPWITCGPLVGSLRKCARVDLYEQCSLHITENTPSSTRFGSRLSRRLIRAYSSSFRPCSRTMSGVIAVTAPPPSRFARHLPRRRGRKETAALTSFLPRLRGRWPVGPEGVRVSQSSRQGLDQALEQRASRGGPEQRVAGALRVRHHAEHVAFLIEDAGNVARRSVRVLA